MKMKEWPAVSVCTASVNFVIIMGDSFLLHLGSFSTKSVSCKFHNLPGALLLTAKITVFHDF